MTPEDIKTLQFALANVNSPRSSLRMDAALAFKTLNRKYTRPVVDATTQTIRSNQGDRA